MSNRTPYFNRYNADLLKNLKRIAKKTRVPMSRLLDEGLEYLTIKYLGNTIPKTALPETLPSAGDHSPEDLISIPKMATLLNVDVTTIRYWVRHDKIKAYTKSIGGKGLACVSKNEVLAFNNQRLGKVGQEENQ